MRWKTWEEEEDQGGEGGRGGLRRMRRRRTDMRGGTTVHFVFVFFYIFL